MQSFPILQICEITTLFLLLGRCSSRRWNSINQMDSEKNICWLRPHRVCNVRKSPRGMWWAKYRRGRQRCEIGYHVTEWHRHNYSGCSHFQCCWGLWTVSLLVLEHQISSPTMLWKASADRLPQPQLCLCSATIPTPLQGVVQGPGMWVRAVAPQQFRESQPWGGMLIPKLKEVFPFSLLCKSGKPGRFFAPLPPHPAASHTADTLVRCLCTVFCDGFIHNTNCIAINTPRHKRLVCRPFSWKRTYFEDGLADKQLAILSAALSKPQFAKTYRAARWQSRGRCSQQQALPLIYVEKKAGTIFKIFYPRHKCA